MDGAAADADHVVEGLAEREIEVAFAARHGRQPELAFAAERRVDAELDEAVALELLLHGRRRMIVGKLQLDRLEAGRGRRREALNQGTLGEKIREIGGKTRHSTLQKDAACASDLW